MTLSIVVLLSAATGAAAFRRQLRTGPAPAATVQEQSHVDVLPILPNTIMSGAFLALDATLHAEADKLQERMSKVEDKEFLALSQQKAQLEGRLRTEEENNGNVSAANVKLSADISFLEKSNAALKERAQVLRASNGKISSELKAMQASLGSVSQDFSQESSEFEKTLDGNDQDASFAQEDAEETSAVQVADQNPPPADDSDAGDPLPDDGDVDFDDDSDSDGQSFSFLSLRLNLSQSSRSSTVSQSLLKEVRHLSNGLGKLSTMERQNEVTLDAAFQKLFAKGKARHTKFLKEQDRLLATKKTLASEHKKLAANVKTLQNIHAHLSQQLQAIKDSLHRIDKLATG